MNDEALQRLQKLINGPRDGALLRFGLANEHARLKQWLAVAEQRGDKQAAKEMAVFARRIEKTLAASGDASDGTRCRWYGCASVAGGTGRDHHTTAARVRAAPRAAYSGARVSSQGTANTELCGPTS